MIELILAVVFGGMLWVQEHQKKREANKEALSPWFYFVKYGTALVCVALIALITKVRFFSS